MTAFPCGQCYCGCGTEVPATSFFVTGHDKVAESRIIKEKYGSVAEFVKAHGGGPCREPSFTTETDYPGETQFLRTKGE